MAHPPPLQLADFLGPTFGAVVFVALMSRLAEPLRRNVNTLLVAGACGAYLNGGFGLWELVFPLVVMPVAYQGLRAPRFIGIAWLMHSAWDALHYVYGNAIWPFMPTSSFGCLIFDALIAIWFLAGAPSLRRAVPVAN